MTERLFCFGLGYAGMALARALVRDGWHATGTRRQADASKDDVAVAVFSGGTAMANVRELTEATHLLATVPPDSRGDPVLAHHASDIAACGGLRWAGYLSTTGVYGDTGGDWVEESAAPRPTSVEAKRCLAAEAAWLDLGTARGVPVHVFRLSGIYGPGRNTFRALRAGTAVRIDKPGHAFSRIHVVDIVSTLRASMACPDPGAVYNVCDDEPAAAAEVIAYAASLLGRLPPPLVPFERAHLRPRARDFYADNRRVSNRRIKDELGVRLCFPSYREGLAAILAEGGSASAEAGA